MSIGETISRTGRGRKGALVEPGGEYAELFVVVEGAIVEDRRQMLRVNALRVMICGFGLTTHRILTREACVMHQR